MNWLSYVVIAVCIWMIILASFALHETLEAPGPAYTTFVKWFSALSITVGSIVILLDAWLLYHHGLEMKPK